MPDAAPDAHDLTLEEQVRLLSGHDQWHTEPLPGRGSRSGVPSVMVSDGPHGLRAQRLEGVDHLGLGGSEPATCFPTAVTLASTWDEPLVEEVGRAVGTEARLLGVDVVLGPGLNLKRHPLCGRNFEYFSEDPLVSGRLAAALVQGIQGAGVGACLKHFAVNNQESHRFVVDAVVDERTMRELYLSGFEHAVTRARPWTVMSSYNLVGGVPASQHQHLIAEVLRGEWGFEGLVMSDWGAVVDRAAGVAAGMDLEMPGGPKLHDAAVLDAVRDGRLDPEAVAASAQRVIALAQRAPRTEVGDTVELPEAEHDALARRAAAAGTVLLANDGVLPLAPDATVALVGAFADEPRYQGSGSSLVNPLRVSTAMAELRRRGVEATYSPGYRPDSLDLDAALVRGAVSAAREADVAVVLVGLPPVLESEGFDRTGLALPEQHDRLVAAVAAANPRTVVAVASGGPVTMPWLDDVAAVLASYLGGQAGGAALVDVLYGDAEPAGRLAESFPRSLDDVASDPFFPGEPRQVEHREGLFVGYRHHVTAGVEPLFPFGHGLGYAQTTWQDVSVDRTTVGPGDPVTVSLTVTNTGTRAGSDVVQVYVHDRTEVVLRPRRELGGFTKLHLAPGESQRVEVEVTGRALAYWDVEAHDWRTPSGAFGLEVARSSADAAVVETLTVEVEGGVTTSPEPPSTPRVSTSDADFTQRLGHPVPTPKAVRPFTRDSTFEELATDPLGAVVRTALWRASGIEAHESDPATLAFLRRGFDELPLRAAALLSGGRLDWRTVDLVLDAVNRRPVPVARALVARGPGWALGAARSLLGRVRG